MCTVVILRRPWHRWPLILAANRDEMKHRPWRSPARHWPDHPNVVAGLDELAGGSWLGLNDDGVVAAVLNRVGSLGPTPGKRSRGELILRALDEPNVWLLHLNLYLFCFIICLAHHAMIFWITSIPKPIGSIKESHSIQKA